MEIVYDILLAAKTPLHINHIIQSAKNDYHRQLRRESWSVRSPKSPGPEHLRPHRPNTFALPQTSRLKLEPMHRLGSALVLISSQERAELERLTRRHSAPRRTVQRAQIILLAAENQTVTSIATTLHLCANTVRKWIGRYTHKLPPTPPPKTPTATCGAAAPTTAPIG